MELEELSDLSLFMLNIPHFRFNHGVPQGAKLGAPCFTFIYDQANY